MLGKMALCLLSLFLAFNAAASKHINLSEVKKLNLSEAQDLVAHIQSSFPLEVNERVLKWLNHYLFENEGRAYVLSTLANMTDYESMIKERLQVHQLPFELMAVPFVESGFRNGKKSVDGSVGIWQFVPYVAKKYGLMVNDKVDDRFDVSKLTMQLSCILKI